MKCANHRERQFMQHLRGASWVKAISLPNSPKLVQSLVDRGWIECRQADTGVSYRLTKKGLKAKMAPVRV